MFRSDSTLERQLFAFTPRDLVPEDSDIYLYMDIFEQINLDDFYSRYSPQGQDSVDPRLMLRTIFYGLTHSCATGRKLEAACRFDNRYLILSGARTPSYRCFHRFFNRHEEDIVNLFVDIIRLAQSMNLVSLGNVAIDGTRIKGHTARDRTVRYAKSDKAIEAIKEEIKNLKTSLQTENHGEKTEVALDIPKEIQKREVRLEKIRQAKERLEAEAKEKDKKISDKAQISVNDPDARGLGSNNGKERYIHGYNMQAAVDEKSQIIIAADICDSTNDHGAFKPMLDQVHGNTDAYPQSVLADAGYLTAENLGFADSKDIFPCVSLNKEEERSRLNEIAYIEDNLVECRGGLRFKTKMDKKEKSRFSVSRNMECSTCPFTNECSILKRKGKDFNLPNRERHKLLTEHWERSRCDGFKDLYKQRKAIVEPVFGNLKVNKALHLFRVGRKNALIWWKMVCTAHNVEKLVKAMPLKFQILHSHTF